jgi:hypothetical protein
MHMVQYLNTGYTRITYERTKNNNAIFRYNTQLHTRKQFLWFRRLKTHQVQLFVTKCVFNDDSSNPAFFLLFWQVGTMKRAQ